MHCVRGSGPAPRRIESSPSGERIAAGMGLPVAGLSDEKTPLSSVSNNIAAEETTVVVEHPDSAMDPADTTSPLEESERITDAASVKIDDEKIREDDVLSTGLDDDATFITAVPVIQNLADVVEVMSVVANDDSEPQHQELQPPAPPIESVEGGDQKNEPAEEAGADVKQEGGNTDEHMAGGPDIDQYFLSGGDEKEEENGENEPHSEGADYEVVEAHQALPFSERRKQKRLEVFVGGLDKETTEEDLSSVFKKVGDVLEVRLMKNPQTGKNKGYAFIRYATAALAKKAARELERVEIRGRSCGVLPSEENDTLFLGNISRSWKKEQVLDALKSLGVESVEDITLMEDPQIEGGNRGFAFIEFSTHKEALSAFRRLQQNDAIFGTDRSAKVSWAQPLNEPDEDTMSQVKSVFVDGMPPSWDEEKVKEHFGTYGAIERIVLARNMLSAKRKDFGFVNYVERDGALLCIEALNNTEISDGDLKMKVKVMLAKPQSKNKPAKGGTRGGYPSQGFRGDNRIGPGIGSAMKPVLGPVPGVGPGLGNLGMGMSMGMGMGMGLRGGMGLLPYDVLPTGWGNMGANIGSTIGANIPRFENQLRFGNMRDRGFGMSSSIQRPDAKKAKKIGKRSTSTTNNNNNNYTSNNNKNNNNKNNNNKNSNNKYNDVDDDSTEVDVKTKSLKEENAGRKGQKSDSATKESPQNGDVSSAAAAPSVPSESQPAAPAEPVSKPSLDKFECSMCGFGSDSAEEYETHKKTKVHKLIEGLRKDQKLNNKTPLSLLHEYTSRHHCEVHYETEAETNGPFEVTAVIGAASSGGAGATPGSAPTKGFGVGRNKARAKQMAAASALEKILEKVSESELTKPGQSRQRFDRPNRKGKGSGSSAPAAGNRNSRGRATEDWRSGMSNSSSSNKNKRTAFPASDLGFLGSSRGGGGGAYLGNPNAIPLNGYNDFVSAGGRSSFGDRFGGGRGGGGAFGAGGFARAGVNPETYAERYDRIQSGRGYGVVSPGFGAREFGSVSTGGGFGSRDLSESTFPNRELPPPPPLPSFNGRDMPALGFVGGNRDYEASPGIKRPFVPMDEETRFVEAQRAHPRQCLESLDQVSIHSNANAQGFGVQQMFSESQRSSGPRSQEQPQFNAYVQPQPQGLSISHNIVQPSHIPNQHPNMSIAMVGIPTLTNTQGGTPYSIYDAASQPNTSLSTSGYANMNQDYMVNTASISEMPQGNSYPTQSTYGVPYGVMQQTIPSQVVGNFAPMQNCIQQQSFY